MLHAKFGATDCAISPTIGCHVDVNWTIVSEIFPGYVRSRDVIRRHEILYDDGDSETLELSREMLRFGGSRDDATSATLSLSNDLPTFF